MANLYTVAGQHFFIGNAPMTVPDEDLEEADFAAVTWVEIGRWSQAGPVGDAANLITTALINQARDIKQKGTRNAGSMQNMFAIDLADAGQQALIAAEAGDQNWPFRIQGNDEPASGSNPIPSERYFVGLVMSAQAQGGQANTAQLLQSTVEINSNVVVVAPQSGDAPANVLLPAISGVAQEGEVLTVWEGTWLNGVDSFTYQWQNEGVNIGGATSATYTPVAGDVGDNLTCVVTATNGTGSTAAETAETIPVIAA